MVYKGQSLQKSIFLRIFVICFVTAAVLLAFGRTAFADASAVKLSKAKVKMVQYETYKLKLTGAKGKVTWKSSNKKIAKVSSKGKITAVGKGTCTITAKYAKKKYTCTVKVKNLKTTVSSLNIIRYRQKQLSVNSSVIKPVWSSSDETIASVSETGLLTALKGGTCTITAKYKKTVLDIPVSVTGNSTELLQKFYDPANTTGKKRVVLAGSSSLDLWTRAEETFAPYEVINTAIAGTRVVQWLSWYQNLITVYDPDAVIIYVGANDIGNGDRITPEANAANTKKLLKRVSASLKKVPVYYVSICPCYARPDAWEEIAASNALVKAYCDTKKYITYIDLTEALATADGKPNEKYFLSDRLHPNEKGYKIWKKLVAGPVKKKLKSTK